MSNRVLGRAPQRRVVCVVLVGLLALSTLGAASAPTSGADRHIEFVVDVSGSMSGSRIAQAKTALGAAIDALRPTDAAALRSFSGSCSSGTRLLVDFGLDNQQELRSSVNALGTGGRTPTPVALQRAADDLAGVDEAIIVLVSDGQSTCGDPCPVAQQIASEHGTSFRAITVGFHAPNQAADELECIANATGGQYFSAQSAQELADAINDALDTAARYVAFGDSYSSGEGADDYAAGTDTDYSDAPGDGCRRSANAYPQLIAEDAGTPEEFDFVACSGARTWHFYEAQKPNPLTHDAQFLEAELPAGAVDHDTSLITLTIGGNDAGFGDILKECAKSTVVNPCSGDPERAEQPFQDALSRMKGEAVAPGAGGEADTRPLAEVYADIRERAPEARVLVLGYPQFYKDGGTLLFKCSGLVNVDQLWVNKKVKEFNEFIEATAESFGFEFVETSSAFDGHRLCEIGGGEEREWFRDLQPFDDPQAQYHPDADGHRAMADQALDVLAQPRPGAAANMHTGDTVSFEVLVELGRQLVTFFANWPGSDVEMTVTSPSGMVHARQTVRQGTVRQTTASFERLVVENPEPGAWTVTLDGIDLDPGGELVRFTETQTDPLTIAPVAVPTATVRGVAVRLDGTGSFDPDGEIVAHDWFVTDEDGVTSHFSGPVVSYEAEDFGEFGVTLRVTDDGGRSNFRNVEGGVVMRYDVEGPSRPLDAAPAFNDLEPGRTLPLKWRMFLNDVPQTAADSVIGVRSVEVDCQSSEPLSDAVAATGDLGWSGSKWQFDWTTERQWSGSCRHLLVDLADGSTFVTAHAFR